MYDRSETSLALDDGVGDTHLAAEGGEEDNQFDGVNVVGDQDQGGFLGFDEAHDVVETIFDGIGFLEEPRRFVSQ